MNILFINACVRSESRTLVLANDVIGKMKGDITEVKLLEKKLYPLDNESLAMREKILAKRELDHPMLSLAREFATADEIVIAAPFWDLSFPSMLKIYLEHISVAGVTFEYRSNRPVGLCRAKRLTYVTTSGGPITVDFGYSYVKALANNFFGINETLAYRAMMLDVKGISAKTLLEEAEISVIE